MSSETSSESSVKRMDQLTTEDKARIERNRQKALLIRQEKQKKLSTNELYTLEAKKSVFGHSSGVGVLRSLV